MRILGIDYGDKKIGLSLSDPSGTLAFPYRLLRNNNPEDVISEIKNLVKEKDISEIIIGLPRNTNNSIGERGKITLDFVSKLQEKLAISVKTWDERFTTRQAKGFMNMANLTMKKRKEKEDMIAAQLILQNYLDYLKNLAKKSPPVTGVPIKLKHLLVLVI